MLEAEIEKMILHFLNYRGIFAFKVKTTGTYDPVTEKFRTLGKFCLKGTSDILGILHDGRFLAIEVKSFKGKVTAEQNAFISKVNACGGIGFVARSIDDVVSALGDYL